jgi:hypothetical protein
MFRLQAVLDVLVPRRGGALNHLVGPLEPTRRHRHDFAALPVDGQRSDAASFHVIKHFVDENREPVQRHAVTSLVLKTIVAINVTFVSGEQND